MTSAKEGGSKAEPTAQPKNSKSTFFIACTRNNTCFPLISCNSSSLWHIIINTCIKHSWGRESKKAKQYWRHAFESPFSPLPSFLSGLLDREGRGGEKLELAAAAVAKSYSPSSGRLLTLSHVLLQRSVISLNFRFFQRPEEEEEEEDTETKQQLRKTYIFLAAPNE